MRRVLASRAEVEALYALHAAQREVLRLSERSADRHPLTRYLHRMTRVPVSPRPAVLAYLLTPGQWALFDATRYAARS